MSRKRSFAPSSPESELIEIYEDLSSLDEDVRLGAARALVVKHIQSGTFHDQDVMRILRRLLRGVGSGRKAARVGFSVALTESLNRIVKNSNHAELGPEFPAVLFQNLKEQTDVNIQSSKQEGRDHYHGQLFGITALIRSNIFFLKNDGAFEVWGEVIEFVLELASKKSWLREECGFMLYTLVKDSILPTDSLEYTNIILKKLNAHQWLHTPEGVAFWLALQEYHPDVSLPDGVWHRYNPLDRKEKKHLSRILTGANDSSIPPDEGQVRSSDGRWSPTIHFAWQAVVSRMFAKPRRPNKPKAKPSKPLSFDAFWEAAFDHILFTPKSSQEKKYKGLLLFQHCIAAIPALDASVLFTPNFVQCFSNHLAVQDRYLHRASDKARKALLKRSTEDANAALPILRGLLSGLGCDFDLDGRSKTKTMEELIFNSAKIDASATVTLLDGVVSQVNEASEAEKNRQRLIIATAIVAVFRRIHGKPHCTEQGQVFVRRALFLLASWAYSDEIAVSSNPQDAASISLQPARAQLNARISACFSHVLSQRLDTANVIYNFFCDLKLHLPSFRLLGARAHTNRKSAALLERSMKILFEAWDWSSQSDVGKAFQQAVVVLLGIMLLALLGGDLNSVSIIEELLLIFEQQSTHVANIDDPASFVQILLDLVSRPSLLLRRTVNQVFAAITNLLDEAALQAFLDILETKEGPIGQASLFDSQDDQDDLGESDTDDPGHVQKGDDNSDVSPGRVAEDNTNDTSSNDSDPSNDEAEEDDEELAEFERKLANALGTQPDHPSNTVSGESSSGEEMDDDQMELIDQSLQSMFKERKNATNRKQEQKGAKELIINFKCRVLELLEIFVKLESQNPRSLILIMPILRLIRTTSSPMVSRKACDVIKLYFHVCKGDKQLKVIDATPILEVLRSVHDEARRPASNAHINTCSNASLLLTRVLAAYDRNYLRHVIKLYGATQEAIMFNPKVRYKVGFFTDWLNWSQSIK